MGLVLKFLSKKLLVVLIPLGLAVGKNIVCKSQEALDWKVFGLIGFYVVANVVQKVFLTWITLKYGAKSG